mmetsp:Transcript_26626/g.67097  ORF Transcript_26626/g.67097 Transcript_26626/m.67097 type:complete len:310 (+) Transcript_26626:1252-2181(+)
MKTSQWARPSELRCARCAARCTEKTVTIGASACFPNCRSGRSRVHGFPVRSCVQTRHRLAKFFLEAGSEFLESLLESQQCSGSEIYLVQSSSPSCTLAVIQLGRHFQKPPHMLAERSELFRLHLNPLIDSYCYFSRAQAHAVPRVVCAFRDRVARIENQVCKSSLLCGVEDLSGTNQRLALAFSSNSRKNCILMGALSGFVPEKSEHRRRLSVFAIPSEFYRGVVCRGVESWVRFLRAKRDKFFPRAERICILLVLHLDGALVADTIVVLPLVVAVCHLVTLAREVARSHPTRVTPGDFRDAFGSAESV